MSCSASRRSYGPVAAVIAAAGCAAVANAADIVVPGDYPTLADAVAAAKYKDRILIKAGTYSGPGWYDVEIIGKTLTIDSADRDAPIIDVKGAKATPRRGLLVAKSSNVTVHNIAWQNGYLSSSGGLIACTGSTLAMDQCGLRGGQVFGTTEVRYGGLLYASESAISLTNCEFVDGEVSTNTAEAGGGCVAILDAGDGAVRVSKCLINAGRATNRDTAADAAAGGGLYVSGGTDVRVESCTVQKSLARHGGGVYVVDTTGTQITSCTIEGCTASADAADALGGGAYIAATGVSVSGGAVSENVATSQTGNAYGGGLYVNNPQVFVHGGTYSGNSALGGPEAAGGGIGSPGPLYAEGAKVTGNSAESATGYARGGGIWCGASSTGNFDVAGCTITGNTAATNDSSKPAQGGGVYASAIDVSLASSTLSENRAEGRSATGGGAWLTGLEVATADGCTFEFNVSAPPSGITDGGHSGGGLNIGPFSSVTDCTFRKNSAQGGTATGGGLLTTGASVTDSTFEANAAAKDGAGIYVTSGFGASIDRCGFYRNAAEGDGGAVFFGTGSGGGSGIRNSLVVGNEARHGGGLCTGGAVPSLVNTVQCTIVGNRAAGHGGGLLVQGDNVISACILWGNGDRSTDGAEIYVGYPGGDAAARKAKIWYGDTQRGEAGIKGEPGYFAEYILVNTSRDPLFAKPLGADGLYGTSDEDYHLLSRSPCIEWVSSSSTKDLGGQPRVHDDPGTEVHFDGNSDIGCYEFQGTSCWPDCNRDEKLNVNDFICFQSEWRAKTDYGDYKDDGRFDVNDFIVFQADWRKGCP